MGEIAYASRKYTFAERRLSDALVFFDKAALPKDVGYAKALADLGLLFATTGRYSQAEEYTGSALALRKEILGEKNVGVAASLNNEAVLHHNLARYHEAEQGFDNALTILDGAGLAAAMQYAIVLNNKSMLYQSLGRYDQAEQLLRTAIATAEKLASTKSSNHLKFMSNLALLYQQMGKHAEAESLYLGMEKRLGKNNPDYANMLINLAALYMQMNKDDKVEEPLKKAVSIYKSNFGDGNPAYARALADLGNFYRYKTRYAEAEAALGKALQIREVTLGKNHPAYVQNLEDVAIMHWKMKAWNTGYATYREVMDKSLDFVNQYFPPMSEAEKTKYWDVLFPRFQRFFNFALEASLENTAVVQDICDYQMATKGLLLAATSRLKTSILESKDKDLVKDYVTWLDQKERLARLYAYSKEELKEQRINLDSLERAANSLERKLSEKSVEFSAGYTTQKSSCSRCVSSLAKRRPSCKLFACANLIRLSLMLHYTWH
ncbi:MAG: tetratricopeptide repeat protein [Bacteroidia bacterium]|nr:tetratricopeptide repeat protein [Bacteroidia bacterium]